MKRLCTICARGGSKGVKNKNTRTLVNKPLIAFSIIQAKKSGLFEFVAVSSDSLLILDIAKEWGADYLIERPDEMATDHAAKLPAIRHCVMEVERKVGYKFDIAVDLDATSPLRDVQDIIDAVTMLEIRRVSNIITGSPSRRSPYFNLVELNEQGFVELSKTLPSTIIRRQDAPICYDMNASIYVWWRNKLIEQTNVFYNDTLIHVMPEERSIDIDSELDWEIVNYLMNRKERAI